MVGSAGRARKYICRLALMAGVGASLCRSPSVRLRRRRSVRTGTARSWSTQRPATCSRQANPDAPRHPASLAKLMTLYMAFEALRDRRISLNEMVPVSAHAASMEPSKLGLLPGTRITVEEAILGLVTKSANDAAAALGELLGGSEDRFAQMMTLRARALGMSAQHLHQRLGPAGPGRMVHGPRPGHPGAALADRFSRSIYAYFSTPSFTFQRPRSSSTTTDAAVLSRRGWHEDRLHRGVRP